MSQTVRAVVARAVGEPVSVEMIVVPDPLRLRSSSSISSATRGLSLFWRAYSS